jgi:hypothetical protein
VKRPRIDETLMPSEGGARGPHALFDIESGTAGVNAPGYSASVAPKRMGTMRSTLGRFLKYPG